MSSSGDVPPSAATTTSVSSPGFCAIFCTSESGMVIEPMPSDPWSPIFPMPTISYGFAASRPATSTLSPTSKPPLSAVAWSIVTWPGSSAGPPST